MQFFILFLAFLFQTEKCRRERIHWGKQNEEIEIIIQNLQQTPKLSKRK